MDLRKRNQCVTVKVQCQKQRQVQITKRAKTRVLAKRKLIYKKKMSVVRIET